jgi:hypothetical protein
MGAEGDSLFLLYPGLLYPVANLRIDDLERFFDQECDNFDQERDNIDMLTTLLGELSRRKPTARVQALKRRVMSALSVVEKDKSDDAFLLDLTPAQLRRVAEIYRRDGPDWTAEERAHAAKLAEHHEMVAKGIERRLGKPG